MEVAIMTKKNTFIGFLKWLWLSRSTLKAIANLATPSSISVMEVSGNGVTVSDCRFDCRYLEESEKVVFAAERSAEQYAKKMEMIANLISKLN